MLVNIIDINGYRIAYSNLSFPAIPKIGEYVKFSEKVSCEIVDVEYDLTEEIPKVNVYGIFSLEQC